MSDILPVGAEIEGRFRIDSLVGEGGMARVYRGWDLEAERPVAIKVMKKKGEPTDEQLLRFEREAEAIRRLDDPGVVRLYGHGRYEGCRFLVMEYVDGKTLKELIRSSPDGYLLLPLFLAYGKSVCRALCAAHGSGIVHRDLKPQNVMVVGEGRIKVLDFGLAKLLDKERDGEHPETLTYSGEIVGTPQYLSPEQAEGKKVDERTDLFALGCLLFEMATGRPAFNADNRAALLASILKDEPPAVSDLSPSYPYEVDRLVAHCLEKKRENRPSSAYEVLEELERIEARSFDPELGRGPL